MKYQKLAQHILQIRGISFKPEDVITEQLDGYVPVIKSNNITENGFDDNGLIYIKIENIRPEQFIRKGDLVLTASSGSKKTIGKNIQFDSDYNGSFGAFCKLIRPKPTINPKYLYHFFKTRFFRDTIEKAVQGANIANLKNEYINELKISLPPLEDQIRIAAVLIRAEKLIAKRKESIKKLDEFVKSTFLEMFGDPVKNEKGWIYLTLGTKISIKHGFPFQGEYFSNTGKYVLLTPGNFYEAGGYRDRGERQKYYIGEIPREYLLDKGDLLIAMTEQAPGLLGSPIIVPDSNKFLHNQRLGLIVHKKNDMNNIFLFHLFNHCNIRKLIHSKASGTKVRHTSPTKIEEIKVSLPPLPLQTQFAAIVEKVESLKSRYAQSLTELENLYSSLSQRAFKGELDLRGIPPNQT